MSENDAKANGGVEAVVRAMAEHGSSAKVPEAGCMALSWVASQGQGLVLDAGAIPLIKKAMAAFPDQEDIQRHGKASFQKGVGCGIS